MAVLQPLLDTLALAGIDIVEVDQDKPLALLAIQPEGRVIGPHEIVVSRLGGTYDRATSSFKVIYIEGLCHSCNDFELFMTSQLEELMDLETGELLTAELVAARIKVAKLILS